MRFSLAKEHIRHGNVSFKLSNFTRASKYYTDAIKSIMPQRFLNELERHTSDLSSYTGNMDTLLAYIDEEIEHTTHFIGAMKAELPDFPTEGGLKCVMTTMDTARSNRYVCVCVLVSAAVLLQCLVMMMRRTSILTLCHTLRYIYTLPMHPLCLT